MSPPAAGRLQRWILAGLILGLAGGIAANLLTSAGGPFPEGGDDLGSAVSEVIQPLGGIFLRLLFLTVIPLVFSCLALGVHGLGDLGQLGRIGVKTLLFTLLLSSISVAIGIGLANSIRPGDRLDPGRREALLARITPAEREGAAMAAAADRPLLERVIQAVIPQNPVQAMVRAFDGEMLGVMFFAVLFGAALGALRTARTQAVVTLLEGLQDVSMWLVGLALKLAPLGVAALVFSKAAQMGIEFFFTLGAYVLTVLAGLAIQQFAVYPLILRLACGWSPAAFFSRIRAVMVTAFSTSSSNATLPTTIQVARDELRVPPRIADFVLTLGSTFNQNGTALFEGVTVLFLAQFYGVPLGLDQQLFVVGMSVAAGVGTAGVPGGSIPLIVPVLVSVGIPGEGIAVILGVDRFLDMCRTVLNVTGDLVAATFVARGGEE